MTTKEFLSEIISCLEKSDKIKSFVATPTMEHIFSSIILKANFKDGTSSEYRLSVNSYSIIQNEYLK